MKLQNEHLNQVNVSLMQTNKMMKHDLQEINKNYLEMVHLVEEVVKIIKITWGHNIHLIR